MIYIFEIWKEKKVEISFTEEEYEAVKRLCKPDQPFSTFVREKALEQKASWDPQDEMVHRLRDIGKMVDIGESHLEELTGISREAERDVKVIREKVSRLDYMGESKFEQLLKKQEELLNKQKTILYWITS